MITVEQYFMGRDLVYALEVTQGLRANAAKLVDRVNLLLDRAAADGVAPGIDEKTGNDVASGWRPRAVNERTANSGKNSTHIAGLGVDLQDTPNRDLARWCVSNLDVLEELGLYMEDPQWTPDWVHLQIVAPGSGRRVYIPSTKPPLVAALPEQLA